MDCLTSGNFIGGWTRRIRRCGVELHSKESDWCTRCWGNPLSHSALYISSWTSWYTFVLRHIAVSLWENVSWLCVCVMMHDLWMFYWCPNTPSKYLNLNVFSKQHVFLSDSWASATNQFEVFKLEAFAGDLHLAVTIERSLGKMSFVMFLQTKISLQNNKLFDFHAWIFFYVCYFVMAVIEIGMYSQTAATDQG